MQYLSKILLCIISLGIVASCSKDDQSTTYSEPIAVLQPSTNPANVVKGAAIKYDVRFTNDEYIDSVMVYLRMDTTSGSYVKMQDSLVQKKVFPLGSQSNEQALNGSYTLLKFPIVGQKMYLWFNLISKNRNYYKRVTLVVT